jgi:hypothetical protein
MRDVALVRRELAKHPEVSQTWFEWTIEDDHQLKTLVVEVKFDTDPNSKAFNPSALDEIRKIVGSTLREKTPMVVSYLRIVPKRGT